MEWRRKLQEGEEPKVVQQKNREKLKSANKETKRKRQRKRREWEREREIVPDLDLRGSGPSDVSIS